MSELACIILGILAGFKLGQLWSDEKARRDWREHCNSMERWSQRGSRERL